MLEPNESILTYVLFLTQLLEQLVAADAHGHERHQVHSSYGDHLAVYIAGVWRTGYKLGVEQAEFGVNGVLQQRGNNERHVDATQPSNLQSDGEISYVVRHNDRRYCGYQSPPY